jgi:hypothetical protein
VWRALALAGGLDSLVVGFGREGRPGVAMSARKRQRRAHLGFQVVSLPITHEFPSQPQAGPPEGAANRHSFAGREKHLFSLASVPIFAENQSGILSLVSLILSVLVPSGRASFLSLQPPI